MPKNIVSKLVLAVFVLAVAAPAASDDLTVVSTVTSKKGKTETQTQYLTADKVKISDGELDTIFDLATGRMVHVDHKKKTWYETSLEELRQQFAELEQMLRDTPMMAKMFGAATAVEVREGSGSRTVAGYDCDQYFVTMGEKFQFEIYAARDLRAPAHYHDARKLLYAAMGPMGTRFEKMVDEMKKIEGFPLWSKTDAKVMGFDLDTVSEATEVRKGPIDPSVFDPPAGYKQKKSPYAGKK